MSQHSPYTIESRLSLFLQRNIHAWTPFQKSPQNRKGSIFPCCYLSPNNPQDQPTNQPNLLQIKFQKKPNRRAKKASIQHQQLKSTKNRCSQIENQKERQHSCPPPPNPHLIAPHLKWILSYQHPAGAFQSFQDGRLSCKRLIDQNNRSDIDKKQQDLLKSRAHPIQFDSVLFLDCLPGWLWSDQIKSNQIESDQPITTTTTTTVPESPDLLYLLQRFFFSFICTLPILILHPSQGSLVATGVKSSLTPLLLRRTKQNKKELRAPDPLEYSALKQQSLFSPEAVLLLNTSYLSTHKQTPCNRGF